MLGDLAGTLEQGVEAAIVERADAVETAWKDADGRLHQVETRLAGHVAAAAEIKVLLDRQSDSWEAFVQSVLEADRSVSHRKVEALDKYEAAHKQRAEAARLFERGLVDVNQRLQRDREGLAVQRTTIRKQEDVLARFERELPVAIGAIDAAGSQLAGEIAELHARQVRHLEGERSRVAILTKKLAEVEQETRAFEEERRKAVALQAREMREREQLLLLKAQFEGERTIWGTERVQRTTPLTDEFLEWLEKEVRNRAEGASGTSARLLKWLTKRNRRRRR